MKTDRSLSYWYILLVGMLYLLMTGGGCGGGSSGTGSGPQVYSGYIVTTGGEPVPNARVTIEETGDSSTTKSDGSFSIESEPGIDEAVFVIDIGDTTTKIPVNDLSADSTGISLAIDEKDASQQTSSSVDIRVKFVGTCDIYFENTRPIRQSNRIPGDAATCTLKVSLRSIRGGLPNRTFEVQKNNCETSDRWRLVTKGQTGANGVVQVPVEYKDSEQDCLYRVLVPLNDNKLKPLSFEIWSDTYQNFLSQSKK